MKIRIDPICAFTVLSIALSGCWTTDSKSSDLAGTSVTTGNPVKVMVSFKEGEGSIALTGRVDLFGAAQIPIPHFQPDPLATYPLERSREFILSDSQMAKIPDSAWREDSLSGDSLARFNLVFIGDSSGAIVKGLVFNRKRKTFAGSGIPGEDSVRDGRLEIATHPAKLESLVTYISAKTMSRINHNYLYVQGTGYSARSKEGEFVFPFLPRGRYTLLFMTLPDPEIHSSSGQDSTDIYQAIPSPSTGTRDTIMPETILERIRLPEEWRTH